MVVASDIVDDALEWMLEGWHFGERESRYSVAGYVPSLKSDGFVRAGSDQVLAQADAEDRASKRKADEHRDEAVTGSPRTKAEKIERNAQFRLGTEKVAKDGNDHEKHLDFTETTLKFGLFCITLMFFRAMSLVRRERDTFAGTHDAITSEGNPQKPTEERRKMRREKALLEERQKKKSEFEVKKKRAIANEDFLGAQEAKDASRGLVEELKTMQEEHAKLVDEAQGVKQDRGAYRKSAEVANGRVEELTEQLAVHAEQLTLAPTRAPNPTQA